MPLRSTIAAVWGVVLCAFFIQTGNGLQSDLIGIKADSLFASTIIGLMFASYYVGFSLAPFAGRAVIRRVGHVAAVSVAMAAAAVVILVMPLLVSAPAWTAFRFVSGFCLSFSYIAVESWINAAVPNQSRGRVFSAYMVAQMIGMTLAQVLFGVGRSGHYSPYVMAALMFVLAGLPVVLSRGSTPSGTPPSPLSIAALFRRSPAGAAATVLSGLSWSILFTFGPIYARRIGFDTGGVGLLMGLAVLTGSLVQLPVGWLSDVAGRRRVLLLVFGGGLVAAMLGLMADGAAMNLAVAALAGGFVFPIYAIAISTVNDAVAPETRVAAASGLVLLFGAGSVFGPLLCGWAMDSIGLAGFYGLVAATMTAGIAATALTRTH